MAKVLISMQEDFLHKVDDMAKADYCSRSDFIRRALRLYIRRRKAQGQKSVRALQNADLLETLLFE
jgi:metal-responsive CopG/Arc/MetJ family transcriptional regulator